MHALLVIAGAFLVTERGRRRELEHIVLMHRTRIAALAGPWRRADPDFPGCVW